ncbi:hypothetical protein AXF42_Ash000274 [Apostasia shenzhenica]|uniref:Uncharacterized protein n=1 Tax=Apostasia shenzhenica TaxID=1088818 RepID=A0A2I0AFX5_9ASPA|nr:hypothetical protein AXF42_Ash000274 [Apostasia shenzhenica]
MIKTQRDMIRNITDRQNESAVTLADAIRSLEGKIREEFLTYRMERIDDRSPSRSTFQ